MSAPKVILDYVKLVIRTDHHTRCGDRMINNGQII